MRKEDTQGRAICQPTDVSSDSDIRDAALQTSSSRRSSGSETVYNVAQFLSGSLAFHSSTGSSGPAAVSGWSPTSAAYRYETEPIPADSYRAVEGAEQFHGEPRGYELCAGCIEAHGIAHSKAAAKTAQAKVNGAVVGQQREQRGMRHTFREKIWASTGWVDVGESRRMGHTAPRITRLIWVDYSADTECTICRVTMSDHRYKC